MIRTRILINNFTLLNANLQVEKENLKITKNSVSLNKSFVRQLYFFSIATYEVECLIRDDGQSEYDRKAISSMIWFTG